MTLTIEVVMLSKPIGRDPDKAKPWRASHNGQERGSRLAALNNHLVGEASSIYAGGLEQHIG